MPFDIHSALRRLSRIALIAAAAAALLVALLFLLLQIPFVARFAAFTALDAVNPYTGAEVRLGGVRGSWWNSLELRDLSVANPDGRTIVRFDTLRTSYSLPSLLSGDYLFDDVTLAGLEIHAFQRTDSSWDILEPFVSGVDGVPPSSPEPDGPGTHVAIRTVRLRGMSATLHFDPVTDSSRRLVVRDLDAVVPLLAVGGGFALHVDTLRFRYTAPGLPGEWAGVEAGGAVGDTALLLDRFTLRSPSSRLRASGRLPLTARLADGGPADFALVAEPLAYRDLHPFLPVFGPEGRVHLRARLQGTAAPSMLHIGAEFSQGGSVLLSGVISGWSLRDFRDSLGIVIREFDPDVLMGSPRGDVELNADAVVVAGGYSVEDFDGSADISLLPSRLGGIRVSPSRLRARHAGGRTEFDAALSAAGAAASITGSARLLDSLPSFTAGGTISIPGPLPDGLALVEDLAGGMRGAFTVMAAGSTPRTATMDAAVTLTAPEGSDALLRTLRIAGSMAAGEGTVRIAAATDEGAAGVRARLSAQDSLLTILADSVLFEDILPGHLLPTDSVLLLSGSARGGARIAAGDVQTVWGEVRLRRSAYGSIGIHEADLDASHAASGTSVALSAVTDAGSLLASGVVRVAPGLFSLRLDSLRGENLDLALLGGGEELPTDLNFRARGGLRCVSSEELGRLFTRSGPQNRSSAGGLFSADLLPSRIGSQDLDGGRVEVSLREGRWEAAAEFRLDTGSVAVRGSAEPYADTARWVLQELRTNRLDLSKAPGGVLPRTRLTLAARGMAEGTSMSTTTGGAVISLLPSTVSSGTISGGEISLSLDGGHASAAADIRSAGGGVHLAASTGLTGDRIPISAEWVVDLPDLGAFLDTDSAEAVLNLEGRVDGVLERGIPMDGELHASGRGRFRTIIIDSLAVEAAARGGLARVERLHLGGTPLEFSGSGDVAFAAPDTVTAVSNFRLTGSLSDAAPLLAMAGIENASAKKITIEVRVSGPPEAPVVRADLAAARASFGDADLLGIRGDLEAELPRWNSVASLGGDLAVGELAARNILAHDFAATVRGNPSRVVFGIRAEEGTTGRGVVAGEVAFGSDSTVVRLDSIVITRGARTSSLQDPSHIVLGRRITVRRFDMRSGESGFSADGTIDPNGHSSFVCRADSLPLGALMSVAGFERIRGSVSGGLTIEGSPGALQARGEFQAALADREDPLGSASGSLSTEAGGVRITVDLADSAGRSLALSAVLPVRISIAESDTVLFVPAEGTLAGSLSADGFHLGFFAPFADPKGRMRLEGLLDADVAATGSRANPAFEGYLRGSDGTVDIPEYGIRYRDVGFDIALQGGRLDLSRARARTGEGTLSLSGTADFQTLTLPVIDLALSAAAFELFRTPDITAVVDADLRVQGKPSGVSISGTVALPEASYRIPESFGGRSEDVELGERDWRILDDRFGIRRPEEAPGDSLRDDMLRRSSVDLRITMSRNVWVKSRRIPRMELELEGNLDVRKPSGGDVLLSGILRPVAGRSYIEQIGRRFKIVDGEVQLRGDLADATMRVVADYDIPSQDRSSSSAVRIRLTATMADKKLTFAFSSDPAMEESEIITYLATGKSTNAALSQAGDMGSLGASVALGQVVGSAEAITEGKLPLDVFQIQQDGAYGVTIVAGTYVGPDTYLGIRQPIELSGDARTSSTSPNVLEFEVEQQIRRWLLFNLQGGVEDLLAFLRFRHTY